MKHKKTVEFEIIKNQIAIMRAMKWLVPPISAQKDELIERIRVNKILLETNNKNEETIN